MNISGGQSMNNKAGTLEMNKDKESIGEVYKEVRRDVAGHSLLRV